MIAVDRSSLSAFFGGLDGADVVLVRSALMTGQIVLPPVVLTEILSDPSPPRALKDDVVLITRDADFRHYTRFGGLKLA